MKSVSGNRFYACEKLENRVEVLSTVKIYVQLVTCKVIRKEKISVDWNYL